MQTCMCEFRDEGRKRIESAHIQMYKCAWTSTLDFTTTASLDTVTKIILVDTQLTYNSHVCVHTAEPHSNIYGFTTTVFLNNDLEVLILRRSVSLLEAPFADALTYF